MVSQKLPETRRAVLYARNAWGGAYMARDEFDSVEKLNIRLMTTKRDSPHTLKIEIENAGGLTSYWDRLDLEVSDHRFAWSAHYAQAVKSAILAVIVRVLGSAPEIAEWLKSEINKEGLNGDRNLLFRAVASGVPETVDLLLVHGADLLSFDPKALETSRGYEMELLLALHIFLWSLPESDFIEAYPLPVRARGDEIWAKTIWPFSLLQNEGVTRLGSLNVQASALTWIHVPRNNVSFPYLVLTTINQQEKDRKKQKDLSEELSQVQLIDRIRDYDLLGRTLDEAYYPGISPEALDLRNQDQVVSQSEDTFESYDERERQDKKIDGTSFILMVPQLWLYKLGGVVVSSYTMPHGTGYALDGYDNEETFANRGVAWPPQANELVDAEAHLGLIMTGFIDRFGEHYTSDGVEYPPPLDLFETRVVGILSEVTNYVKKVPGDESNISKLDYRRERYFIHVISDVRSELAMIKHVLEQQERVLKQFLEDCLPAKEERPSPNWVRIKASQETIQQYMRRVEKIDGDADRIEKNIQDMLNLKRTHASIRDAHSSLILSTAVIGFTVITIVFTPLAFLTALFALKIDGFENLQISGSDGVFHRGKISGIFVSTEILTLLLTGIAVWLAFKYMNRDQERSSKEKTVAWLKSVKSRATAWLEGFISNEVNVEIWLTTLIAWSSGPSRKKRAKAPDPETPNPATAPHIAGTR
ncbi:unnamed protein product [Alternaria alternata]